MLVTSRDRIQKLVNEGKTEQRCWPQSIGRSQRQMGRNDEQAKNWTRMVYNSFKRS